MARRFGESESKYLKGSDLLAEDGKTYRAVNVEIDSLTEEEIGEDNTPKFILYFKGKNKGIALNVTNETFLIDEFGHPDGNTPEALTQHFSGRRVVLYFDPTIMFGRKRVGGLRLRRAANRQGASAPEPPQDEPLPPRDEDRGPADEDEIPF